MPKIFEIESQSRYRIKISTLENLEDAGEDFITEEELTELGITQHYGGTRYFDSKIKTALNEVLSSIKDGKKSGLIKDDDLVECLKESYYPVSHWVTRTRRVGNRLFKGTAKKEQEVPSFANWKQLVEACNSYLSNKYDTDMNINPNQSDRVKTIDMYKLSVDWDGLEVHFTEGSYYDDDNIKWYKSMWEDSKTIPLIKSSN